MKWLAGILGILVIAALAGGISWVVVSENSWTARCHRAGGHNQPRREGVMLIPVGKTLVPMPRYSNHCIVDGREVTP